MNYSKKVIHISEILQNIDKLYSHWSHNKMLAKCIALLLLLDQNQLQSTFKVDNSHLYSSSVGGEKAFWLALHSDTARTQLQWHVSVCMTIINQSEARVVNSATNERPGMPLMTHRTHTAFYYTCSPIDGRQEEGGDVYLLWHLCSRDNDLSSEREYVHVCSLSESQCYWYWSIGRLQRDLVSAFTLWINTLLDK